MSESPKQKKRAKFYLTDVPREAYQSVKVYDRYGNEQKDIIEFDPETGKGKRIMPKTGNIIDVYFYNGYIVADGMAHPDEDVYPEIIANVRKEVNIRGRTNASNSSNSRSLGPDPVLSDFSPERTDRMLKSSLADKILESLHCPKCQSVIRFDDDQKAIVCSNGSCGMKWHSNGGVS